MACKSRTGLSAATKRFLAILSVECRRGVTWHATMSSHLSTSQTSEDGWASLRDAAGLPWEWLRGKPWLAGAVLVVLGASLCAGRAGRIHLG